MKTVNTCTYTTSFADKSDTDGKSFVTALLGFYVRDYFFKYTYLSFRKSCLLKNKCYNIITLDTAYDVPFANPWTEVNKKNYNLCFIKIFFIEHFNNISMVNIKNTRGWK